MTRSALSFLREGLLPGSRTPQGALVLLLAAWAGVACRHGAVAGPEPLPDLMHIDQRWASSRNLAIAIESWTQEPPPLTRGERDFKPSWSSTGSLLTFFRLMQWGNEFYKWRTTLQVIGTDGSSARQLTGGRYADFNPTWTRDGTNQIIFNRYAAGGDWYANAIYLASPTGSLGDEVPISDPDQGYEWAFSGLRDGRIFIDRVDYHRGAGRPSVRSFLLTPRPGAVGTYEEITRPTDHLWHKLTVSPSETKVAYMLDYDWNMSTYEDVVLFYADFDARTRVVSNPVAITTLHPTCIHEYPAWSADESLVIYDSNCSGVYQMYAYRLSDGTTHRISPDPGTNYQFGCFENLPK